MKIDPSLIHGLGQVNQVGELQAKTAVAPADMKPALEAEPSRVELSPLALNVYEKVGEILADVGVNSTRVAEVRQALASGTYEINTQKIAESLIQESKDFLNSQS